MNCSLLGLSRVHNFRVSGTSKSQTPESKLGYQIIKKYPKPVEYCHLGRQRQGSSCSKTRDSPTLYIILTNISVASVWLHWHFYCAWKLLCTHTKNMRQLDSKFSFCSTSSGCCRAAKKWKKLREWRSRRAETTNPLVSWPLLNRKKPTANIKKDKSFAFSTVCCCCSSVTSATV